MTEEKISGQPLISICIPAYKRVDFLKDLLDSIAIQKFTDFEVIVTDDSPDGAVAALCEQYGSLFPIRHFRNEIALGTPENWNQSIRLARGHWIKLMHDDDSFSSPEALGNFAEAAHANPDSSFIFSAYVNLLNKKPAAPIFLNSFRQKQLLKDPVTLLSKNVIGPPSVVLHRNDGKCWYDKNLQWLVDMDFYIRYLDATKPVYIREPLINIGINEHQVTKQSSLVAEIEIPEHFAILNKTGTRHLKNILVFDAWWRLFRNLQIRSEEQIRHAGYNGEIPGILSAMIAAQSRYSYKTLRIGIVSKLLMFRTHAALASGL